jgi:hypothetical protein
MTEDEALELREAWEQAHTIHDMAPRPVLKAALSKIRDPMKIMSLEEIHHLKDLGWPRYVYRGICSKTPITDEMRAGFSWTISKTIAERFASRFPYEHQEVVTAESHKFDVAFYTNARREEEVVVIDPDELTIWRRVIHPPASGG